MKITKNVGMLLLAIWLILWGLLVTIGILSTPAAAPSSIEGMVYTRVPMWYHLLGLPEVVLQTLAFSIWLVWWERQAAKSHEPEIRQQNSVTSDVVRAFMAACFALFAVRSFCWLLYIDDNELRIQSPNNLGDLALHITLIKNFASGVPLWPDNPIYVFSKLRYPAGMDLFNALLCLVHVDLTRGLVWTGLAASAATFYAFLRWAGAFGVAGFLWAHLASSVNAKSSNQMTPRVGLS